MKTYICNKCYQRYRKCSCSLLRSKTDRVVSLPTPTVIRKHAASRAPALRNPSKAKPPNTLITLALIES